MAISLGRYTRFSNVWYILIGGVLCASLSWKRHIHSHAALSYFVIFFSLSLWNKMADSDRLYGHLIFIDLD